MKVSYLREFYNSLCELKVELRCFSLISQYRSFLMSEFCLDRLEADEIANKSLKQLEELFDDVQVYFESAGLPCPYIRLDNGLIMSFTHLDFTSAVNWDIYRSVLPIIVSANPNDFLILCALALVAEGNAFVVIKDSPGDGGVDIVAKDKDSSFNCKVTLAQVKKASSTVDKKVVIYENANFWDEIIRHSRLSEHYKAINVREESISVEVVYHFMTNQNLSKTALSYAKSRAIKVRLAREIAAAVSRLSHSKIVSNILSKYSKKDLLGRNLSDLIVKGGAC